MVYEWIHGATTYRPFEIRKCAKNRKPRRKKVGFWDLEGSKIAGFAKNSKELKANRCGCMKREQRGRQMVERSGEST